MTDPPETEFGVIADLIRQHALRSPRQRALVQGERCLDYAALAA